jgi:hypothetical protein
MNHCPPPARFKPAGHVFEAHVSFEKPAFDKEVRRRGRRALGVKYEKQAQEYLQLHLGEKYVPSPWLRYRNDRGWNWCQPDGLILDVAQLRVVVIEIKYSHTANAWWQVEQLYKPVLRALFKEQGQWRFDACEVVRWYDPLVAFPTNICMCADVAKVPPAEFGLHIYRP